VACASFLGPFSLENTFDFTLVLSDLVNALFRLSVGFSLINLIIFLLLSLLSRRRAFKNTTHFPVWPILTAIIAASLFLLWFHLSAPERWENLQ
jgi:hypothetical protein